VAIVYINAISIVNVVLSKCYSLQSSSSNHQCYCDTFAVDIDWNWMWWL